MEYSQTELGSSTAWAPATHIAFGGEQEPCAPCWFLQGYPPLPWIERNHNSQQPHGSNPLTLRDLVPQGLMGVGVPAIPQLTSFQAKECGKPESPRLCKSPNASSSLCKAPFFRGVQPWAPWKKWESGGNTDKRPLPEELPVPGSPSPSLTHVHTCWKRSPHIPAGFLCTPVHGTTAWEPKSQKPAKAGDGRS